MKEYFESVKGYFESFKEFCEKIVGDTGAPWWVIPAGAAFIVAVIL